MNANIRFEIIAEAFHRFTGMLAPGKDSWQGPSREERRQAFDGWMQIHGEAIGHILKAVEENIEYID